MVVHTRVWYTLNVPESHIDTCDSCIYVVKAIGADRLPTTESENFQSPASVSPIDDSHLTIYQQLAKLYNHISVISFDYIPCILT